MNMKLNKFVNLLVIGLVLCVAASGCKKKPVGVTDLPGARTGKVPDMGPGGAIKPGEGTGGEVSGVPTGHPQNAADAHAGWLEDTQALKTETVYFDFDSSVIKTSEQPKVSAVADYLKANSAKAVRIEGNCDERGTAQYNIALGARRANAVKNYLADLGVKTKFDTVSFGKELPVAEGSTEGAWSQNRRAEMRLPGDKRADGQQFAGR